MERLTIVGVLLALCGCGGSPTGPTQNMLVVNSTTPTAGATVIIPEQYQFFVPGGVVLQPGFGLMSVNITMSAVNNVPWAQLNVYLLTGGTNDQYCGQNANDSPTWQFLTPGWTTSVTVTGFRVYQLPCDVTGFRAIFHMRNNGNATPPSPSETIAEATVSTNLHLRR